MVQLSFASLSFKNKVIRTETFLNEMNRVVPWAELKQLIEPLYPKYDGKGRKPMDLMLMIRIYCLQQWYNLSDPAMEEAIYDRFSFQKFLDVDRMGSIIPDETTILQFRHLLEAHQLTEKIFETINAQLVKKGLLIKKGTIVDATIVTSASSTKNEKKERDPEMSSTRKNGQYYFGMKVHTGVDAKNGTVHSVEVTTANTPDISMVPLLLHGEEESIHGDKAYCSDRDKFFARDAGVFWGILDKRKPHQKLSQRQKTRNRKLSSIRAKVEFSYNIIKNHWGHKRTRYRGLHKNRCQWFMLLGLSNLYLVRKKLMAIA